MQISLPKIDPAIDKESYVCIVFFPSISLMPELGTAYAGECLTWRAANQNIYLFINGSADAKIVKNGPRIFYINVTRLEMSPLIIPAADGGEVGAMGFCRPGV